MIPVHVAVAIVRVFRAREPDTSVNVVSAKASASASFERELHHWISTRQKTQLKPHKNMCDSK